MLQKLRIQSFGRGPETEERGRRTVLSFLEAQIAEFSKRVSMLERWPRFPGCNSRRKFRKPFRFELIRMRFLCARQGETHSCSIESQWTAKFPLLKTGKNLSVVVAHGGRAISCFGFSLDSKLWEHCSDLKFRNITRTL